MRHIRSRFVLAWVAAAVLIVPACGRAAKSPLAPTGRQAEDRAAVLQSVAQSSSHHEVGPAASILSDKGSSKSEVEFKGKVESVGSNQLKVSGVTVLVDAKTEIERRGRATLSEFKVGETVHVEGTLLPNGTVLARHLELSDDRVDFHGKVKVVDSTHLRVGQVVIVVDARTSVLVDCNGASAADIKSDQTVRVTGVLQDDNTVLAVQINVSVHVSVEVTCRSPRPRGGGDDDDDDDDDD